MFYTIMWCMEISTFSYIIFIIYAGEKICCKCHFFPLSGIHTGLNIFFGKLFHTKGAKSELVR